MSFLAGLYPVTTSPPAHHPRSGRPNYNQIHAKPLPLDIYPLPPLIPHNPLSILHIALTYILQLVHQSSSHSHPRIHGYYSPATNSVHITDPPSISHLWQHGFFGKGSLSRSEPTWLDREKKRLGILAAGTSEEHTASRRNERRRFKNERARKEREAIDEKLMEELLVDKIASSHKPLGSSAGNIHGTEERKPGKPTLRSKYEGLAEAALLSPTKGVGFFGGERMLPTPPITPSLDATPKELEEEKDPIRLVANGTIESTPQTTQPIHQIEEIKNQEHLQLTPEEAFFLSYALGILDIYPDPTSPPAPTLSSNSTTPTPLTTPLFLANLTATSPPNPSDPFLLNYTTYHHFRAHGWVVRPGLKFGVDYLLYLRGPVFSHAEFAVVIQPAYTDPFWKTSQGRKLRWRAGIGGGDGAGEVMRTTGDIEPDGETTAPRQDDDHTQQRSWHWLHCLQRVQSQVRKTLVIAWVDVPPPPVPLLPSAAGDADGLSADADVSALLQRYKVREMVMKRWIPNRSRD